MKKFYIAVQIKDDTGKMDALIIPVTSADNITSKLKIRGLVSANIFATLTAARAAVLAWRDGFRAAGVYKWDTMPDGTPAPF